MMPAGHHSDSDSALLPLPRRTWVDDLNTLNWLETIPHDQIKRAAERGDLLYMGHLQPTAVDAAMIVLDLAYRPVCKKVLAKFLT